MKNFPQIASRIFNKPLLLDPSYAQILFGALSDRMNISSLIDTSGKKISKHNLKEMAINCQPKNGRKIYHMVGDIAIIPVQGSLTHNLNSLRPYSGMTGYDGIEAMYKVALNDSDVKGILLDVDSPGGEVSGCFDCADFIHSQRDVKPVWSISNEFAASAAYAISSAASRIILPRTADVGSVGVLTAHVDQSKMLKKRGVKVTLIYSGEHKVDGNPYAKLKKSVFTQKQEEVNAIRQLFVETVAKNRNTSAEHIYNTEARVYSGSKAVEIKMADEVLSYNDTLIEFQNHLSGKSVTTTIGATKMAKVQKKDEDGENQTSLSSEDLKKAKADAFKLGAESERTRCAGILNSDEAKGRTAQANHMAFKTDMSVDNAVALLATAPQSTSAEQSSPLDKAMAETEQPKIGADDNAPEKSKADTVFADFQQATNYQGEK